MNSTNKHNIALLPPPAFLGHLIPFIELAKKLVSQHNVTVTLIIPNDNNNNKSSKPLLQNIPTSITPVFLPPVSTDDLPENTNPEMLLPIRVIRSLPFLRKTLSSLQTPASALILDLFAPYAIDVAKEFNIPVYIFYVVAANELSLSMDLPKLDETCTTEYRDMPEPIKLPGGIVLGAEDLPDSMVEKNSEVHKWMVDLCKKYLLADGIIVNSFLELEFEAFKDLEQRDMPPVYQVGPLIRTGPEGESDQEPEIQKWLNDQTAKSVIYVSFGSGGTLSMEQFTELALGLEMSGHRFLWVVRAPQENASEAYLNTSENILNLDPLHFLPQGFLERTKNRGLVVASWAPQIQILGHGSTGGFLTHCGWNSILESAVFGVPMIAWPLCFEHKMNAVFLRDGLKGAIRVKGNENGVVERGEVCGVVKELMEGEEGKMIRERMMDVKIAAEKALSKEGSSSKALAHVVQEWIRKK
ncbi:hypothetical protein CASFOL_022142 [Castilleja foliolosa]|uniref:Glycosyltransferase n=1 Tax=Castilleja foliolosa TaxID=1961234 RepID=A0ABD3CZD9_9LAMI